MNDQPTLSSFIDAEKISKIGPGKPIDWNKRLDLAISGNYTEVELELWTRESRAWITCAVGNLCDRIPRHPTRNKPIDGELCYLGVLFFQNIKAKYFKSARRTLRAIERRSAKLLRDPVFINSLSSGEVKKYGRTIKIRSDWTKVKL